MKKLMVRTVWAAALAAAGMSMTAYAGSWKTDSNGRWYQNDDGSYPRNGWQWIDSDYDGVSECYYFDENGYVLTSTTTPDGCEVNGIGAWVKDGEIQTKSGGSSQSSQSFWDSGSSSDDSWDSYFWGGYDPFWYEKDETLSEGDKAAYHYYDTYFSYETFSEESWKKVNEQYERIAANPCSETASQEMVWVEIPVWRLKNGQKVAGTAKVQVLGAIADEVRAIFTEIYNGPEQFPIESVGGYSWRSNGLSSNHSAGLAIDINPDQNPQVRADGTVLVGSKWEPGVNPYSIGRDSDVLKAFGKYGWSWGAGYSTKDYMHFEW